jgi:uncharacterized protein (DUF488 family)
MSVHDAPPPQAISNFLACELELGDRCHQRIIANYLIAAGESVFHILGPDSYRAGTRAGTLG